MLELQCEIIRRVGPVGFGMGHAYVDGKLAAQAELTFALVDADSEAK